MTDSVFAPGSVLWLFRHEFRLFWRRLLAGTRPGAKPGSNRGLIGIIVLGVIIAVASASIAYPLARYVSAPPHAPVAIVVASAIIVLIATLMLSQSMMAIVEVIYVRNDLDLLLASPLPPWRVLLVRTAAVAISSGTFYLIAVGAFVTWMAIFGAPAWLVMLPAVLALSFTCTGLALMIVTGLFRVIGPRQTRVLGQVLAALIGAGVFLGMQAYNFSGGDRASLGRNIFVFLRDNAIDTSGPLWIPARALLGDWLALPIWLAIGGAVFLLGAWLLSRGFVEDAAAAAGASHGRRRAHSDVADLRGGGLTGIMLRKEYRLLRRDPLLISQIGLQMIYYIPAGFLLWRSMNEDSGVMGAAIAGGLTTLAGFLTGGLVWVIASAEESPELIAAAPVATAQVERAKLIAAIIPAIALSVLLGCGLAFVSWTSALSLVVFATAAAISTAQLGIWYQKPGKRTDFRRRRSQTGFWLGLAQTFVLLGWGGAAGLAASPFWPLAIIPAIISLGLLLAMGESRPKPV